VPLQQVEGVMLTWCFRAHADTMMKFGAFENVVQALYKYVVPKPKAECNKTEQLGVSFAAG
jgi:solute carrier family 25 (mitochondrial phosphate transporter), member 3